MIYLNPFNPQIIKAREVHSEGLLELVMRRIGRPSNTNLQTFLTETRVKKILNDPPDELVPHQKKFFQKIPNYTNSGWDKYLKVKDIPPRLRQTAEERHFSKYKKIAKQINSIFKYSNGFDNKKASYSAYDLANNLNIQSCVYCNRIYTKTVITPEKYTRPQFDHWYPKGEYPILALSFYNLIPSCAICNSGVKGSNPMNLGDYIHPYMDKTNRIKFSYWIESTDSYDFKIKTPKSSKEEKTVEAFKLKEIYETHRDEIHDLVRLKKLYSIDYLIKLKNLLSKADSNISLEELYRLAFGTHMIEANFHKRPLSKMKKDLLEELNMVFLND